ncbi:hypothetical protein [Fredinandcohnia onubensis]|uniref:hypothetical protein n=1 Tax=Fredinandcohnia onubensis TaxID=1571209 RepID=UPI000C0BF385|nr:hypothetical protein [Fredinandcohnia onubensis]
MISILMPGYNIAHALLSIFIVLFFIIILNVYMIKRYKQELHAEQRKLESQERYYRSLYELNPLAIIMMDD